MIDAFFDLIADSLVEGKDVKISGFGNFQIRTKAPRPGRNPRTGEAIPIGARRVVTFHASHKLKEQIQGEGDRRTSAAARSRYGSAWLANTALCTACVRRVTSELSLATIIDFNGESPPIHSRQALLHHR